MVSMAVPPGSGRLSVGAQSSCRRRAMTRERLGEHVRRAGALQGRGEARREGMQGSGAGAQVDHRPAALFAKAGDQGRSHKRGLADAGGSHDDERGLGALALHRHRSLCAAPEPGACVPLADREQTPERAGRFVRPPSRLVEGRADCLRHVGGARSERGIPPEAGPHDAGHGWGCSVEGRRLYPGSRVGSPPQRRQARGSCGAWRPDQRRIWSSAAVSARSFGLPPRRFLMVRSPAPATGTVASSSVTWRARA